MSAGKSSQGRVVVDGALDHAALRARHHALRQPLNALVLLTEALKLQSLGPGSQQGGPTPASQPLPAQPARAAQQARLLDGIAEAAQSVERLIDALFVELQAPSTQSPPSAAEAPWDATQVQPREPAAAADGGGSAGGAPLEIPLDPPLDSPPGLAPGPSSGPAAGRRIVVVDDDETTRVGLAMVLEALGAHTVGLGSIQALQDWLQSGPGARPDLAVIDYHLPRPGQGLEALRMLRRTWPTPPLRVLLITGDGQAAMSHALTDGSFDYLLKPVKPHELRAALQRQLGV